VSEKEQDEYHHEYQSQQARRAIAPAPGIRISRKGAHQHQDQQDDKNGHEHGVILPSFGSVDRAKKVSEGDHSTPGG
jgi:hypothetical protein